LEKSPEIGTCLGVFDANASTDHVTFSPESGTIKPLGRKAFMRKTALFYPLAWEKKQMKRESD